MNKYFVSATAKYPLKLKGKYYKIGDVTPTELTEKEYNFIKDALEIESVSRVKESEIIEHPELEETQEVVAKLEMPKISTPTNQPQPIKRPYIKKIDK